MRLPFPRLVLALAALAGLSLCGCRRHSPPPPPGPPAGSVGLAPGWQLPDLKGGTLSLDQLKGKVVVLDFWATWCGPCRQEIPGYVELAKKYAGDGLVIVGVSLDQNGPEGVKEFVKKYEVSYPIVMGDDKIVKDYGSPDAIPTTFIIDRDGYIRDKKVGAVPEAEFERRLLKVLKPGDSGT